MSRVKDYLEAVVATALSITGIVLLFVGTYLGGFGWSGLPTAAAGIVLFVVGTVYLLRQDSEISRKLTKSVKGLLMST